MASNLTSPGTFSESNMKIDPGEQLDAIFLQKLAENTAWNRARQQPWQMSIGTCGTQNASTVDYGLGFSYQIPVMRVKGHNRLYGTYTEEAVMTDNDSPDTTFTKGFSLYGDLGTYNLLQSGTHPNLGSNVVFGSTYQFGIDMASYLSEGRWGTFVARFWGTTADHAGISETIRYQVGTPVLMHSDWS